ncbi:type IV secretory system conjugative DNA transfer family protein [Desulfoscipio geothermicus]|uniref:Type IV secretory pathway, VirD4 component, TraG/TraD family ATPase n=1 Tax=Desulfoscipio geothermicus DSM 3669 TaxID=1121426 RepID=A0A1I6EB96_9FIRM|nr:TraM recognition domain-containing protein [Desulfoscipio geothermicus]SFR15016.1 Type IV secretory pathway, VirD4 component, TraG/TraD family ATPase [Desulfoscipio geothermicus DSM 3669]
MIHILRDRLTEMPAKCKWLALAGLGCLGLAVAYILDVWLLGTAAAYIMALVDGLEHFPSPPDFSLAGWYWHHPMFVARAWLFATDKLSSPEVRTCWLYLNGGLAILALIGVVAGKIRALKKGEDSDYRDIRKICFKQVRYNASRYLAKTPENQYFLGLDDRRRPITVSVSDMAEHIHIMGGSGTGKTAFGVTPICMQAIRKSASLVVIDFKEDKQAIQLLAKAAEENGKRFYFFTLDPSAKSNTYNPLATGAALNKVERIMTALELVFQGEAKFYSYVQQATFIPLLKELDSQGIKYTLADIQSILQNPGLVLQLTGQKVDESQIKGLTAALTPFADLEQINSPRPDIDLAEIMQNGDVVYFDLKSALAPEASSAIGKMIAQDLQYQAAFRTPQSRPTIIAIDEFQNMACQAFRNIISKVRSANYGLVLANQAMGDLQAVGDDFVNTVQVNTRTKIIFNADTPTDAELFSQYCGTVLKTVASYSENKTQTQEWMPGLGSDNQRHTVGKSSAEIEVPLMHPNTFKKMPPGKSIIIRRGRLATLANHAYLISKTEKDRLEQLPLPEPELPVLGPEPVTVREMLEKAKRKLVQAEKTAEETMLAPEQNQGVMQKAGSKNSNAEAEEIAL